MTPHDIFMALTRGDGPALLLFTRKPVFWKDVRHIGSDHKDEVYTVLAHVPEFSFGEVYGTEDYVDPSTAFSPAFIAARHLDNRVRECRGDMTQDPDQLLIFIAVNKQNDRRYLINTEGYDYARYAARVQ